MTPEQKALVRKSWAQLDARQEATSALFYKRLFERNPKSRRLFRDRDMHLQGALFIQMLNLFIGSLDEENLRVAEAIKASGRRHVGFGVTHSDYDGAGQALLETLAEMLGPGFDADVRGAWSEAYRTLAVTMQQASSSIL